ncbi:phage holin family protein [Paludifilum halophilum]|uniref:phage holin family protein n=1 Tax=Paludifilum halophilum TaxID=1642702 RepID=UPI00146F8484|nr:phage holin family protein [Paludifilum halophilum]
MDGFKTFLASAFVGISYTLWGEWVALFNVFLLLCAIDWATGWYASKVGGTLNSKRGFTGIGKKIIVLALVAVAHQVDVMMGTGELVRNTAIIFYSVNEVVSITENCGRAGIPVPERFVRAVEVLRSSPHKQESEYSERKDG